MSDLIAMQPNLNIPLYLVAPDDRREKVIQEVNTDVVSATRPTTGGHKPIHFLLGPSTANTRNGVVCPVPPARLPRRTVRVLSGLTDVKPFHL
jgi:hypothetical protein